MRNHFPLVLVLALGCSGELIDNGLPPGNEPPTSFTPGLAFRFGGTGNDLVRAIRTDPAGNIYVTGTFTGVTTLGAPGANPLSSLGAADGFLAKYDPSGTLLWARRFGGNLDERVTSLAVDGAGNAYVGGGFEGGASFENTGTGMVMNSLGGEDGFVASFGPDGTLAWVRRFGGFSLDEISALSIDPAGNLYAAGAFTGQANAAPDGGPTLQSNGGLDGFVLALTSTGTVRWAIPLGGPQDDAALGVAAASTGEVAVAGTFHATADLARGGGVAAILNSLGGADVFFAVYSSTGALEVARGFGGTGDETMTPGSLALDATTAVLVGGFRNSVDFDPGPGVAAHATLGTSDLFASRFDLSGNFLGVATVGGINASISAARGVPAPGGGMLVTGAFSGTVDFDPGTGVSAVASLGLQGVTDAFVAQYSASGALSWVSRFGEVTSLLGHGSSGTGLGFDAAGNPIVAGYFTGTTDLDPGPSAFRLTSLGDSDGFLVKLTPNGALAP